MKIETTDASRRRFGEVVRDLRKAKGWSQEELGRQMRPGDPIHRNSVRGWEDGSVAITPDNLELLAAALGSSRTVLLHVLSDRGGRVEGSPPSLAAAAFDLATELLDDARSIETRAKEFRRLAATLAAEGALAASDAASDDGTGEGPKDGTGDE